MRESGGLKFDKTDRLSLLLIALLIPMLASELSMAYRLGTKPQASSGYWGNDVTIDYATTLYYSVDYGTFIFYKRNITCEHAEAGGKLFYLYSWKGLKEIGIGVEGGNITDFDYEYTTGKLEVECVGTQPVIIKIYAPGLSLGRVLAESGAALPASNTFKSLRQYSSDAYAYLPDNSTLWVKVVPHSLRRVVIYLKPVTGALYQPPPEEVGAPTPEELSNIIIMVIVALILLLVAGYYALRIMGNRRARWYGYQPYWYAQYQYSRQPSGYYYGQYYPQRTYHQAYPSRYYCPYCRRPLYWVMTRRGWLLYCRFCRRYFRPMR